MIQLLSTIDYNVFSFINGLVGRSTMLDGFMILIATYGPWVFDAYLVFLWFHGGSETELRQNRKRAIYAATAALVALGVNQLIGFTWFRQRPYVHHPAHMLLPISPDASFPSDHAAGGFSISTGVFFGKPLPGIILMLFAAILAFSRIYVGLHYPADVIGGALVGILGAFIVEACKGLLELPATWVLLLWQWLENRLPFLKKISW